MTLVLVLKFLHLAGMLGIVAAFGVEGAALVALRRGASSAEDVRRAIALFALNRRLGPPAILGLVGGGVALTSLAWGWQGAWIRVAIPTAVAIALVGGLVTGRRIAQLERAVEDATERARRTSDPALLASLLTRVGLVLGIVLVMTAKPDLATSIGALIAGASLGLVPLFGSRTSTP